MSKEFEEWKREVGVESDSFNMRNCFEAGRTLGRREMKGEVKAAVLASDTCDQCIGAAIGAIEAIPEEV